MPPRKPSQLSNDESQKTFQVLIENIRLQNSERVKDLLSIIPTNDARHVLLQENQDGETVLHAAVKLHANPDIVHCIVSVCPELLTASRKTSPLYSGQTALHIAITDRNEGIVSLLLASAKAEGAKVLDEVLHKCAIGSRFENTVMLGELPLTVAALTFNTRLMEKLRNYGVDVGRRNGSGDNMVHSLIRYAHLYPEKIKDVLKMCEYIAKLTNSAVISTDNPADINTVNDTDEETSKFQIWLAKNNDALNPLQLSAQLGQHAIFKFIMEMKGVYCYVNSEDGLFDVELYDVTDIDTVPVMKSSKVGHYSHANEKAEFTGIDTTSFASFFDVVSEVPTLEMIFNSEPSVVFKFIQMTPLRYVINRKWTFYNSFYAIWGILHVLFMTGFTVYAVRRSEVEVKRGNSTETDMCNKINTVGEDGFVTFYIVLSLFVSAVYFLQESIRVFKGHMPWTRSHLMNCYHNGPFRLVLVLFSLTVIADSVWAIVDKNHKDYILVCAMILGWWFIVFFLRGFRQFSFFTVMIQKVLVGDMFRFSIIIAMELIAFTTGLFITFRGALTADDNVEDYGKLMVMMFKMMFGFTSIEVLFEAREPWFAVCIYTAFVVLTYVLMVNSLIAMMSNTCSVVSKDRDVQFRVQQLSIILFFESVYPMAWRHFVGIPRLCNWYDPEAHRFTRRKRYFMEVKSLHEVTKSKSLHRPNADTMLESIFHTIQNIKLPHILHTNDSPVELVRETLDHAPEPFTYADKEENALSSLPKRKKKKSKAKKRDSENETETITSTIPKTEDHVEVELL